MIARYSGEFFDYLVEGALESARVVVPLIQRWLPVQSVLDVGCGQGAWLKIWQEHGVEQVTGLDGDYVDTARLLIPTACFQPADLKRPFTLGRPFDLVTCLEVAEHLPPDCAGALVSSLCSHSDHVLFSSAVPGTGGAHHINEQPHGYWKRLFEQAGFAMFDCIRPHVSPDTRVRRWYRYNLFLFVRSTCRQSLPESIRSTELESTNEPADVSPLWFKARKAVTRLLPITIVDWLASLNERTLRL